MFGVKWCFFLMVVRQFVYMGWMGWVFDGVHRSEKVMKNFFLNKIFYFVGGSDRNNFYYAKNNFFIRG